MISAMVYRAYGGPERLELTRVPRPVPGTSQLLIRVAASSINPIDWKMASGHIRLLYPVSLPCVPGFDVAGEVVEVGPRITRFKVGDRVHARIADLKKGGACAEFVVADERVTATIPAGMDSGEAAGLPLAGLTALQALRDKAGMPLVGAKQRVLVVGASGGVGHLAVQVARAAGATVFGVCSSRNAALVSSLGAHQTIDYSKPEPYAGLPPFDIIIDCVGADTATFVPLLAAGGQYVSCAANATVVARSLLNPVTSKGIHAIMVKTNAADLQILDQLVERGQLRVVVDSRFPLERLGEAWTRSQSGRSTGKIIVDVAGSPSQHSY